MVISVLSPHTTKSGNTVSSILLSLALAELKRHVFLSHTKPNSSSFETYLGLKEFEDKTSTPTQLVKLTREGAVQPDDISDYCKSIADYLDIFTSNDSRFSEDDALSLHEFIIDRSTKYEYLVYDIDDSFGNPVTDLVIKNSSIVILNMTTSALEAQLFKAQSEILMKALKGKKVIVLCSDYNPKVISLKDLKKLLGVNAPIFPIRSNYWIQRGINKGNLDKMFYLGKGKDSDVIDIYRDAFSLATSVSKAKITINKRLRGASK